MDKKELIFATGNEHKLKEVRMMLQDTIYEVKAMKAFGVTEDIPENGETMHENAKAKSDYLVEKLNISAFGEDSGLEVEALGMKPGIFTARYAGPQRNDLDNMSKLLSELEGAANRKAQFRSVISLNLDGETYFFEGIVKGKIALEMRGENGFGYDPIFIPENYENTFAELGDEVKNSFSHRKLAVSQMVEFLKTKGE